MATNPSSTITDRTRRRSGTLRIARWLAGGAAATTLALSASAPAGAAPTGPGGLVAPTPAPPPTISIDDVTLGEGTGASTPFTFTVTLSKPSTKAVSARLIPVDGTATTDEDWVADPVDIAFAPGETSLQYTVDVLGDDRVEGDEVFAVMVEQLVNVDHGDTEGLGTIVDDDVEQPAAPEQPDAGDQQVPAAPPAAPSQTPTAPGTTSPGASALRQPGDAASPLSSDTVAATGAAVEDSSPARLRSVAIVLGVLGAVSVAALAGLAVLRRVR